ncbi:MAG: DUF2007 domain-containing protein [Candidatus Zixiibacteriota bacterium]|jgi:hypothetical protein
MNRVRRDVFVVIDAGPLAELLLARKGKALLPTLSYGVARLAYSRGMADDVRRRWEERGLGADEVARLSDVLWREGTEIQPGDEVEAYEDPARDEGLRLAVAARARIYLTEDESLLELGEWKGITIVGDADGVDRVLLSPEATAVVFRARSEGEAIRVADALREADVDARVISQQVPWYDGVLVMGQGYWGEIMVFEKDRAEAERIIERLLSKAGGGPIDGPIGDRE